MKIVRMLVRRVSRALTRSYEAASRGNRMSNWFSRNKSAKDEISVGQGTARSRARDLLRNNHWAVKARSVVVNNTIGTGIIGYFSSPSKRSQVKVSEAFKKWANSSEASFDRNNTFFGIQSMVMSTVFESGTCYVIKRLVKDAEFPLTLRVLEPEFLDRARNGSFDGRDVIDGVAYDTEGRVAGYYFFRYFPGDKVNMSGNLKNDSSFFLVDDVAVVFRQERPGMVEGMTWLHPVIVALKDLDGYEDSIRLAQKIAACYAGFISDPDGNSSDMVTAELSEKLTPGTMQVLPPGRDVKFSTPPQPAGMDSFLRMSIRQIAAGTGVTYEALSGDYSDVNFSSGRMGWLEFQRSVEVWRWMMIVPMLLDRVGKWFIDTCELTDIGVVPKGSFFRWTPPRREMIDPEKELNAIKMGVRNGLLTLAEGVRMAGYDFEEFIQEYKDCNDLLDKFELVLDSDPRKTNTQGTLQTEKDTSSNTQSVNNP